MYQRVEAVYTLTIRQPTATVVLFSLLALGAYHSSKVVSLDYQRLAIIVARTSLFVVNLGFWFGSLWGDSLWYAGEAWGGPSNAVVPDLVFVVGWMVALLAAGVWAAGANKRWVVNLVAVFGGIHFYTQLFERFGASPASILFAGVVALGIALAIFRYNKAAAKDFLEKRIVLIGGPSQVGTPPLHPISPIRSANPSLKLI
jgi:iron complex transport system permease protein